MGGCPCLGRPHNVNQQPAANKPAYVGQVDAYGYGCKQHDNTNHASNDCSKSSDKGTGEKDDWCVDSWCIVNPSNCNLKTRSVDFTANTNDYFSYETCDSNFKGNGWVGRCQCPNNANSYCQCDSDHAHPLLSMLVPQLIFLVYGIVHV